jgi:hypothetical protein
MTPKDIRALLLEADQYQRLWKLLEDMETLLWNIKLLNDDREDEARAAKQ